jgi:hypothetical protein
VLKTDIISNTLTKDNTTLLDRLSLVEVLTQRRNRHGMVIILIPEIFLLDEGLSLVMKTVGDDGLIKLQVTNNRLSIFHHLSCSTPKTLPDPSIYIDHRQFLV